MNWEALTAISTLLTFLVIAASATAALQQLSHLRKSNQLSGLLSALETLQTPHFHELVNFVRSELSQRMTDPAFRAGLVEVPVDRRRHPELYVADIYEEIGAYVRSGLIDEELFLRARWFNVLLYWSLLQPAIAIVRDPAPHVFENFEYLAARALKWRQEHPSGNYPSSLPRVDGPTARAALGGQMTVAEEST